MKVTKNIRCGGLLGTILKEYVVNMLDKSNGSDHEIKIEFEKYIDSHYETLLISCLQKTFEDLEMIFYDTNKPYEIIKFIFKIESRTSSGLQIATNIESIQKILEK